MTRVDERLVVGLLRDRGLAALQPLRFAAARVGCTVWEGRLLTPYGDSAFEVLVYPVAEQPESYVDLAEEIESLTAAYSTRHLGQELRDDRWAILITSAKEDAAVLDRFLRAPDERPSLSYHPQLDRVLGGDYFHQVHDRWMRACIAPKDRAMQMPELLKASESAYANGSAWPGKLARPLPELLAVLTVPGLVVAGAPPSFDELALMQFVVEDKDVIQHKPISSQESMEAFNRQLFGFLATQHQAGTCFSRDSGCCIRPEFLLPSGALTDVYFMVRPEGDGAFTKSRETDLSNALIVACEATGGSVPALIAVLKSAVRQYTQQNGSLEQVEYLIESAARGVAQNDQTGLQVILKTLFLKL
jgi:hypothetical protein